MQLKFTLSILALAFSQFSQAQNTQNIDLIIHHAKVYTVDKDFTVLEAVAVSKGRIVEVGTNEVILNKYRSKQSIDLQGKPVYPGFIDGHCHFYAYSNDLSKVNLVGTTSFEDVINRVQEHYKQKPTKWILGRGWDQNDWDVKEYPNKKELDLLFPETPVFLARVDGHAAIANQAALNLAKINTSTRISGGRIEQEDGQLTGVLVDNAVELVEKVVPKPSSKEIAEALNQGQNNCFEVGLTTVDDAGLDKYMVSTMDSLQKAGFLKMRVYAMLNPTSENKRHYYRKGPYTTDYMHVCSFKVYADGALGSRGACMLQPYSDKIEQTGFLLQKESYYYDLAAELDSKGFQMNTHCIGDSSNRLMLNVYGSVLNPNNNKRWRIEHAQIVSPEDIKFFKDYKVIPSVQATHATSDMYWAKDRIGEERMKGAYAYAQLLRQNGLLVNGSDFPVESINPLYGFYAAVSRKDKVSFPDDGFQKSEALTRVEALRAMTIWAAYGNLEDTYKGSIEAGKLADFVVLEDDIMEAPENELFDIKVLKTIIGGETVFEAK